MRRIVGYTLMGLDGSVEDPSQYFAPSDDPGDPFAFDAECEQFEQRTIATQDAVLLGRRQYEEWRAFWPGVTDHPFADFINGVRKHVVTSAPLEEPWVNSVAEHDPVEVVVARLRAGSGGDVGVHGSLQLLRSLLEADLLDELRLVVGPVVGTPGRRLLEGLARPARLRLLESAATSSGALLLTYGVAARLP